MLLVNVASVLVLTALIGRKLFELVRDWRAHVPGSRMKARAVLVFSFLALVPVLLVVFVLAQRDQSQHRQLVRRRRQAGPGQRAVLSRAALSLRTRELLARTTTVAGELRGLNDAQLLADSSATGDCRARRVHGGGDGGRISARALIWPPTHCRSCRPRTCCCRPSGRPYVGLEPAMSGGYVLTTAAAIGCRRVRRAGCSSRATRCPSSSRSLATKCRAPTPVRTARLSAAIPQVIVHADADDRAAVVGAGRGVWRILLGNPPGAAGPGPDHRYPRGGQGKLRHAHQAAVARRDGVPGPVVQRHDQGLAASAGSDADVRAPRSSASARVWR